MGRIEGEGGEGGSDMEVWEIIRVGKELGSCRKLEVETRDRVWVEGSWRREREKLEIRSWKLEFG